MEKLLVFHLDDNNLKKLKQITGALKVRVEEVLSSFPGRFLRKV